MLQVTSIPSVVNIIASFSLELTSGSDYTCTWSWGDGSPDYSTDESTSPITGSTHTHTFNQDNIYSVNITCQNNVSTTSFINIHTVQYRILNIRLAQGSSGALRSMPFNIQFVVDNGTDLWCNVSFDGTPQPSTFNNLTMTGWTPQNGIVRNSTGVYEVIIYCENLVSSEWFVANFTVDMPIVNPSSWTNTTLIILEGYAAFYVTMDEGTTAGVEWDFDDGSSKVTHQRGILENWPRAANGIDPYVHEVVRYYDTPGFYNITVAVFNSYNYTEFHHTFFVMNRVENLTMMSNAPVGFINNQGLVHVGFFTTKVPPIYALVNILWEENDPSSMEIGLDFGFDVWPNIQFGPHAYTELGSHKVWANVSNPISWEVYTITVWVILPITNFRMNISKLYVATNESLLLTASFEIGDQVTIDINWGDGFIDSKPRIG